jgi:hypothetical protein
MKTKIENIDELKSVLSNKEKTVSSVEHFMQPFNLGRTLKNYSNIKQKGFSFTDVLVRLCTIQVLGMSIYQATREQINRLVLCGEKCVYYRLIVYFTLKVYRYFNPKVYHFNPTLTPTNIFKRI